VSERPPRRAAIIGFAGFGNLGDEMILAGIERLLAPTPIEVSILFGGPELAETEAFRDARRSSPWRLLPTAAALRQLRGVDLLVVGGGGLFNDYWPLLIPRYLAWVVAARTVGTRVVWLGVGVGPIRRRAWRWLTRLAARLSATVLVRDRVSADLLGGTSRRVRIIPDPVAFLEPLGPPRAQPELGLIVRAPVHGHEPDASRMVELLAAFAAAARSEGLRPRLMMMAPAEDRAFAERVAARLARDGGRPPIEALGPSAAEVWHQLGGLEASVSVRLHGVLLSALAGVACVPIAYDSKVAVAAERLGLGDVVIDPGRATGTAAAAALAAARDPARARLVGERISAMRGEADEVRAMLQ
jgi:polysaccharide pyruvyl transferase WcaK-like protein